jgi:hypothetical protein
VDAKGFLSADFDMRALENNVKLTDRVKFFFFFRDIKDGLLKPVCASHMALSDLADAIENGGKLEATSNFTSNRVKLDFHPHAADGKSMHVDLLKLNNIGALSRSVLWDSVKHLETMKLLDKSITQGLESNTEINQDNGGHMFQSVFSAHVMENEATLYPFYHLDFDGGCNVPPWLCSYTLVETLNHNALSINDVIAMKPTELTQFLASYAQSAMRSSTATPYTQDFTLNEDPKACSMGNQTVLSEVFKRPFSHPYHMLNGAMHGALLMDDCEGFAAYIKDVTHHLGYAYDTHAANVKETSDYLRYSSVLKSYFPPELFSGISPQYQNKVMELIMHLGEKISTKEIECKITLVSANGASMGGEGNQTSVQAHACATMVCNSLSFSVMLEGTTCISDDQSSKKLQVGSKYLKFTDVVNSLTVTEPFNTFMSVGGKKTMAMHVTHSKGSFYRSAFCQNDSMLGSQIGQGPLSFGVDMEYIADDSVKVYMPVIGKSIGVEKINEVKQYIQARVPEIHLPLVDHDLIKSKLAWFPIQPYKGCKHLAAGRPYTTCMIHIACGQETMPHLLERAVKEAEDFNSDATHRQLGVMRAFACMDGISKVFHIYSDDLEPLSKKLSINPHTTAASG